MVSVQSLSNLSAVGIQQEDAGDVIKRGTEPALINSREGNYHIVFDRDILKAEQIRKAISIQHTTLIKH